MQRARHRKSKSASGIEGLEQIQKQKVSARRSTDSRSYAVDGNKRDDMFMIHFGGPSPFRESTGIVPMKKLLAEEMSRDVEPKKRPPSLIARLMGFEGLPPARKQQHQKRLDGRINRGPTNHHEFKDVHEDLDSSSHRRFSSRWNAGPDLTKLEMALIEQKLINTRRLSNGEKDHIAVLKPSNSAKYESKSRDTRKDGLLLEPHSRYISRKSPSRAQSNAKIEENILPTRIIVLKPNLVKEYPSSKDSSREVGLSRPISKEAREIAREITMRMRRDGCDENIGYIGDESSFDDSESELEDFRIPSRKSLDDNSNNIRRYLSSSLGESSVNREARRRLSERWRMSREYRELEMGVSKGSTLGEMLALPDRNGKTRSLGISSRDGWMDELITRSSSSSRSKSLPPSRGHKRSSYRRDESKFVKRSLSQKEDCSSSSKYTKSWRKKPHPFQETFIDGMETSSEVNFEIRMEANIKDVSEQQSVVAMAAKAELCKSPAVDVTMMVTEPGSMNMSPESCESFQKQSWSVIDGDGSAAAQEEKDCCFQELHNIPPSKHGSPLPCLVAELESSENYNKESDHPSPNSVLEVPVAEDIITTASSECFERVGAELQELRLQLKLLKMESTTDHADVSTLFPIDEEGLQSSPVVSEGNYSLSEPRGWEYSYAIDVLITSGIQESDFNMFKASWYSQDCPLDPKLFEDLEMQYNDPMEAGTKLERRLLFDRINWAMLQISLEYIDLTCPWVMPKLSGFSLRWQRQGVRDAVERLIEEELSLDAEVSDREMQWSSCKGEIEMIGNEIEKVLIEEMMAEVVLCM